MLIGLTYDLRADYLTLGHGEEETAEFDKPETVDAIAAALRELGFTPLRIGHVRALTAFLAEGGRADLVFNIAEGWRGVGREAQVPALLDAWDIPYVFSDPLVLALTLHKAMTKRVIRDHGLPTPDFAVIESLEELPEADGSGQAAGPGGRGGQARAVEPNGSVRRGGAAGPIGRRGAPLPYPLFAKPVAEGTGKGVSAASRIRSPAELRRVCADLLERFRQPVLVETYLPGREFTVGLTGTGPEARVLGVMEIALRAGADQAGYSYRNKQRYESLAAYGLLHPDDPAARDAAGLALAAWRALGCRDGGRVDVRQDAAGRASFIEVNPLAGLDPVHSDLPILARLAGVSFLDLIDRIMRSALRRLDRPRSERRAPREVA